MSAAPGTERDDDYIPATPGFDVGHDIIIISNLYYDQDAIDNVTQMFDVISELFVHNVSNLNKLLFISVDFEFSRLDNSIGLVQFKFDQLGLEGAQLKTFNKVAQDIVVIVELRQVKITSANAEAEQMVRHMETVKSVQERFLCQFLFNCQDNIFKIAQGPFSGDVPNLDKKYGRTDVCKIVYDLNQPTSAGGDKALNNPVRYFVKNMLDINLFYNVFQKINNVNLGGALYGFYGFSGVLSDEKIKEIEKVGQSGMDYRREMGDISVVTHDDYKMYCYYDVRYLFECLLMQQNEEKLIGQEFMFLCAYISLNSTLRLFPFRFGNKVCDPNSAPPKDKRQGDRGKREDKQKEDKNFTPFIPFNPFKQKHVMLIAKPLLASEWWKEEREENNKQDEFYTGPKRFYGGGLKFDDHVKFINIPSKEKAKEFSVMDTLRSGAFQNEQHREMKIISKEEKKHKRDGQQMFGGKISNIIARKKPEEGLAAIISRLVDINLTPQQEENVDYFIQILADNRIYQFLAEDTHHKKVILTFTFYFIASLDYTDESIVFNNVDKNVFYKLAEYLNKRLCNEFDLIDSHMEYYNLQPFWFLRDLMISCL